MKWSKETSNLNPGDDITISLQDDIIKCTIYLICKDNLFVYLHGSLEIQSVFPGEVSSIKVEKKVQERQTNNFFINIDDFNRLKERDQHIYNLPPIYSEIESTGKFKLLYHSGTNNLIKREEHEIMKFRYASRFILSRQDAIDSISNSTIPVTTLLKVLEDFPIHNVRLFF